MHDQLVRSGKRHLRAAAAGGVALLALTITALVLPVTLIVFAAFGLLGASWGVGWGLVRASLVASGMLGIVLAGGAFAWSLARVERRALESARAWPYPGGSEEEAAAPPRVPVDRLRRMERLVGALAIAAGVPPPRCAVIVDDAPNCLTVGRGPETAWIVATTGLLASLARPELEAVLAFEIGRVAELDVSLDTVVYACTARVFELWAGAFDDLDEASIVLAPLAVLAAPVVLGGVLLRASALRHRARLADGLAVRYCRNPVALAHGLRRVMEDEREVRRGDRGNAHLWLEYPHTRASRWFLRTHRILPARVEILERLAQLPPRS